MNVTRLAGAYEELLAVADSAVRASPVSADVQARIDRTLAHVLLTDRALILTARQILAGEPGCLCIRDAMSLTALSGVTATTTHAELVTAVRQEAETLLPLLGALPEFAAEARVEVRLVDRDDEHVFESLRWGDLIEMRAEEHLSGHSRLLASLLDKPWGDT